jgi:hypothetical protein
MHWTDGISNWLTFQKGKEIMPAKPTPRRDSSTSSISKRRISEARELWIDYFTGALNSLLSTDVEKIKELTEEEAEAVTNSAAVIADKALAKTEERFPGIS